MLPLFIHAGWMQWLSVCISYLCEDQFEFCTLAVGAMQNSTGFFYVLALIWSFCFVSCVKPSVFTLVKSSPEEGVLDLSTFFRQGRNSSVFHCSCFLWSSGPCDVPELTTAFLLFKNEPDIWFGHTWCFCSLSDGFVFVFQSNDGLFTSSNISLDFKFKLAFIVSQTIHTERCL